MKWATGELEFDSDRDERFFSPRSVQTCFGTHPASIQFALYLFFISILASFFLKGSDDGVSHDEILGFFGLFPSFGILETRNVAFSSS
jgi:hypothetical protein